MANIEGHIEDVAFDWLGKNFFWTCERDPVLRTTPALYNPYIGFGSENGFVVDKLKIIEATTNKIHVIESPRGIEVDPINGKNSPTQSDPVQSSPTQSTLFQNEIVSFRKSKNQSRTIMKRLL